MKKFKLVAISLSLLIVLTDSAFSATRMEPKSPDFKITYQGNGDQVNAGTFVGNSIVISSTIESATTGFANADITAFSLDGAKQWDLPIVGESISGPIAKDASGNIYVLGATTNPKNNSNPTSDPATLNPDNIQPDPVTSPNNVLSNLAVWKISTTGQLQQSFTLAINEAVIPKSISANVTGFNIGAKTASKYLQVSMDLSGVFGTITYPKESKSSDLTQEFKLSSGKIKYFVATKSILGLPSWKPKKPTPVLIQYSKLGQIKVANNLQGTPNFIFFQPAYGVVIGAELTSGFGITIVKPLK